MQSTKKTYSFKLYDWQLDIIESVPDEKACHYFKAANRTQKLEYILREYQRHIRNES